jgi:hypothetical protein
MAAGNFHRILNELLERKPFQAFTVELYGGRRFEVDHPRALEFRECVAVFVVPGREPVLFKQVFRPTIRAANDIKAVLDGTETKDTKQHLCRWFENGRALTQGDIRRIEKVVSGVVSGLMTKTIRFKEDTPQWSQQVAGASAEEYPTIDIQPATFWAFTEVQQQGVLFHELTHLFGGTLDHGYMRVWGSPDQYGLHRYQHEDNWHDANLTTDKLIENADTYEGYFEEYYLQF